MSEHRVNESVVTACRSGDREALRVIYEAYKDKVYSIALYFFKGDEATAKDAAQQVFLKLMTGAMAGFRGDASFTTWLYRLVVNVCIDRHRRRRDQVEVPESLADERRSHEDEHFRNEVAEHVKAALAGLKPKLRLAILLRYFEDLSYEEIAEALDCSKGTVASRLNRGHEMLARKLAHLRGPLARGM